MAKGQTGATDPQTQGTQLLSEIPFNALIGSPLVAAIEAQALAAGTTLRYILSVLYGTDLLSTDGTSSSTIGKNITGGDNGGVMSVTLSYTQNGQNATIQVPLLVLVPIPYLNINSMNINFKADINASTSFSSGANSATQGDASADLNTSSLDFLGFGADIKGGYSSKSDSTATSNSKYSVEYTMNVTVQASGEDMPSGTAKVLNILANSFDNTTKQ